MLESRRIESLLCNPIVLRTPKNLERLSHRVSSAVLFPLPTHPWSRSKDHRRLGVQLLHLGAVRLQLIQPLLTLGTLGGTSLELAGVH